MQEHLEQPTDAHQSADLLSQIHAIIFTWDGHARQAHALEQNLRQYCKTTVVNSEECVVSNYPTWHHLRSDSRATEKMNAARALIDGNIVFLVQADCWLDDFGPVLKECAWFMLNRNVGIRLHNLVFLTN